MTPLEAVDASAKPILEFGRGWMVAPHTAEVGQTLGLAPGFAFWVLGRAGVLGEVDADVAAAAIGFMEPGLVRRHWESLPAGVAPRTASVAYAESCVEWGRSALAGMADGDLTELDRLARSIAAAAAPSVGVLFAGWRVLPAPQDPRGSVALSLNVLRELRGGAHLSAVHAAGIGPVGAMIAAPDPVRGGAAGAERFGWREPYPEPNPDARNLAEQLTSAICVPAFSHLSGGDLDRFVALVVQAREFLDG